MLEIKNAEKEKIECKKYNSFKRNEIVKVLIVLIAITILIVDLTTLFIFKGCKINESVLIFKQSFSLLWYIEILVLFIGLIMINISSIFYSKMNTINNNYNYNIKCWEKKWNLKKRYKVYKI